MTEYFLHVLPDGAEQRFPHEPAVPSLRVTVWGGIEMTRTKNIFKKMGDLTLMVQPRGSGWTICDHEESFTTWRRPAVRQPAQTRYAEQPVPNARA
jgi:hypothetical protein